MKEIKLKKIESTIKLVDVLEEFDHCFNPSLKNRVYNFNIYSEKLLTYGCVFIAELESDMIGFIAFYANDKNTKTGYLTQIATKRNYQKIGVGRKLLEQFERTCVEEGMEKLSLEVNNQNVKAIKFYKKMGYVFSDKQNESSYFMEKNISRSD